MKKTIAILIGLVLLSAGIVLVVWKQPYHLPLLWKIPYSHEDVGGRSIQAKALKGLNAIREETKRRYLITSGYRSNKHNKKVGGVSNSQHTKGLAFDVWVPHSHRADFYQAAKNAGFSAYGWGNNTVHIDMGKKRWWTYDEEGHNLSGKARLKHLHKAPENFKKDFKL